MQIQPKICDFMDLLHKKVKIQWKKLKKKCDFILMYILVTKDIVLFTNENALCR
jgi:hypothetical protein